MGYATDTELETLSNLRHSEKVTQICRIHFKRGCKSCPLQLPCNASYKGRDYDQIIERHNAIESLAESVVFNG